MQKSMKSNAKMELFDYADIDVDCESIDQQPKRVKLKTEPRSGTEKEMS